MAQQVGFVEGEAVRQRRLGTEFCFVGAYSVECMHVCEIMYGAFSVCFCKLASVVPCFYSWTDGFQTGNLPYYLPTAQF